VTGITETREVSAENVFYMASSESFAATSAWRDHLSRIMQTLERSPLVSYLLDSQFRIMYCNRAWNDFASSNGAPQLTNDAVVGLDLFDVIPEDLRGLYSDAFRQVLKTGRVWDSTYQCSSPAVFRIFRMRIHLLKPQNWYIVTNSLMVERAHAKTSTADQNRYVNAHGLVTACAHCRCSRRMDNPDQWDFVPEYLRPESLVKVSHGLCPICRAYFYEVK
jgi:hypothetical protein